MLLREHVVAISCKYYVCMLLWSLDLLPQLWRENYRLLAAVIHLEVVQFVILSWLRLPLVIEKDPHRWNPLVSIGFAMLLIQEQLILWPNLGVP